jgi:uncharacterized protein
MNAEALIPPGLSELCRRHGVRRLAVFGSVARGDDRPDSDLDILVEFLPEVRYSLFDLGGLWVELCELFGRRVDLKTPKDLSPHFREEIVRSARDLYAAA